MVVLFFNTIFLVPSVFVVDPNIVNCGGLFSVSYSGFSAWYAPSTVITSPTVAPVFLTVSLSVGSISPIPNAPSTLDLLCLV